MAAIGYQYEAGTGTLARNEMRITFPEGTRNVARLLHALRQSAAVDQADAAHPSPTPVLLVWLTDPHESHIAYDQARDGILSIVDRFARGDSTMQPPRIDAHTLRRMDEAQVYLDDTGIFYFPVLCTQDGCGAVVERGQTLNLQEALQTAGDRHMMRKCTTHGEKQPKKPRRTLS